jgi:hypothetical protein
VHAWLLGVPLGQDSLLLDPLTATAWTLPRPPRAIALTGAVVEEAGRVWAEAWIQDSNPRRIDLVCTDDPARGWQHRTLSAAGDLGGALVVHGDSLLATTAADGATVGPVATYRVSHDRGATWTSLDRTDLPFFVAHPAVTSGGTLYVADFRDRVWRATDPSWTRFAPVPQAPPLENLTAAGDTVLGLAYDGQPTLVRIDDAGDVTTMPLR